LRQTIFVAIRAIGLRLAVVTALIWGISVGVTPAAQAQTIGGHIGFVLPLVTHAGGQWTSLGDSFAIGFPFGVTFKSKGPLALDLEFVPFIQDVPRRTTLLVHPGVVYSVGHGWALGIRAAFDVDSSQSGFTPLINKSWPIKHEGFFKAYFVEADFPVRFNRPTGGPSTNPFTFAMHFGLGF